MMGPGGVRPVSSVRGPSASAWLQRRREGLEAQHLALDEGRIDDLVDLIDGDEGENADRPDQDHDSDENDDARLAREVAVLASELEERIARVRAETLDELRELDRRVDVSRFGGPSPGKGGGKRGGQLNSYL